VARHRVRGAKGTAAAVVAMAALTASQAPGAVSAGAAQPVRQAAPGGHGPSVSGDAPYRTELPPLRAEARLAREVPGCRLRWQLLAPKADSVHTRPLSLESGDNQVSFRAKQEQKGQEWGDAYVETGRVWTHENGEAPHPDWISRRCKHLIELSGLPPSRSESATAHARSPRTPTPASCPNSHDRACCRRRPPGTWPPTCPTPDAPHAATGPHPPADLAAIVRLYGLRPWIEQS